jgi:ribose 5-phosphate isomerase B
MEIFLGSDHAGFELKAQIREFLLASGKDYIVTDCGPEVFDPMDDYPDFISRVAENVSQNHNTKGIILGRTGQGEAMVANRFPHVRAAVYYGGVQEIIRMSREHNDANVFSLGAQFLSFEEVKHAITLWLDTPFSGEERHVRRIMEIEKYSNK